MSKVAYLILASELLVGDVCRQISVEQSAEGQSIIPAAAEVCDVDVLKDTQMIHLNSDPSGQSVYIPWQRLIKIGEKMAHRGILQILYVTLGSFQCHCKPDDALYNPTQHQIIQNNLATKNKNSIQQLLKSSIIQIL